MSAIVGLDLSLTSAGIAVLETAPPYVREQGDCCPALLTNVGEAGKKTDSWVQRNRRIRTQTRAIARVLEPYTIMLAVLEAPVYGPHTPGSTSGSGDAYDRAGLWHGIIGWLDYRGVPMAFIPPANGHQFVTGRARPTLPDGRPDRKKITIVWETHKWWPHGPRTEAGMPRIPEVSNGDQADALGLAVMGTMHEGFKPPFRPAARHINNVATSVWPTPGRRPL